MGKINTLMKNWWIKGLTYQVILIFIKKNVITLRYELRKRWHQYIYVAVTFIAKKIGHQTTDTDPKFDF